MGDLALRIEHNCFAVLGIGWLLGSSLYARPRVQEGDNLPALFLRKVGPGRHAQLSLPVLINQNNSPGLAFRTEAVSRAGAGPIPCRLAPWHCAQFFAYDCLRQQWPKHFQHKDSCYRQRMPEHCESLFAAQTME